MMNIERTLHFQALETRQLMATDIAAYVDESGSESEPVAAYIARNPSLDGDFVKQNFLHSLMFAMWSGGDLRPVQIRDSIIAVEGRQLRLFAPDDSALGYSQRSLLTTSDRIRNVTKFGEQLLIVTERSNGLQTRFQTNLVLAAVDADHNLQVIDSVERDSKFYAARMTSHGLSILWGVPEAGVYPERAQAELQKARIQLDIPSSDVEHFLYDYLPNGTTEFNSRPLLSARGMVSVLWQAGDRMVVKADDGLHMINSLTGADVRLDTGAVTWFSKVWSDGSDLVVEGGMGEPGMGPFMGVNGYGTVVLDESLNIKSTNIEFTGDQARLKSEYEAFSSVHNDGRVPNVTVFPESNNLRVVTQVDQVFTEQIIDLPGYRVGFTPGFVLDSNTILSVRAHIEDAQIVDGAIPDLTLHLLKRDSSGQFAPAQVIKLPKFDPRATAVVASDGTITLQNRTQALIIRTNNDQISWQSIDTTVDWESTHETRHLTAWENIAFYSSRHQTKILDKQATKVAIGNEPLDPEADDAAFVDLELVIRALQDGTVITEHDLPQSGGEATTPVATSYDLSPNDDASVLLAALTDQTTFDLDINSDGTVTPLDVLLIVNFINANEPGVDVPDSDRRDANEDGEVTPLDVLLVINLLNRQLLNDSRVAVGEGEATAVDLAGFAAPIADIEELNRRRR